MDRPLGPRQPDKRHAAYESIFGRPSAPHHNPHPTHQPPPPHPYYIHVPIDTRPLIPYPTFQQPYYPQQPLYQPALAPQPHPRALSLHSSPHSPGVLAPKPDEPPDPNGLTPAQAYQALVTDSHREIVEEDEGSELPWSKPETPAPTAHKLLPHIRTSPGPFDGSTSSSTATPRSSVFSTSPMQENHPKLVGYRGKSVQDRSMSMSSASSRPTTRPPIPSILEGTGRSSPSSVRHQSRRTPLVYPALLSRVAEALRDRITLTDRAKDGLTYKNAFDGREAVDKIAYIIKTTDRNLALLLGRALDAQKFFHDVTYDHRLRDSANEIYQFKTALIRNDYDKHDHDEAPSPATANNHDSSSIFRHDTHSPPIVTEETKGPTLLEEDSLPSGVFTLLADCYSPTCSRDQLCYSIACPRRLEQQARLNMKPQRGLMEEITKESLVDVPDGATLWIHSVPQEVVNSVSDQEKKRQEAINEVIYTERDFVRDLEYLRESWINRLIDSDVIPQHKRTDFLEQVFWNIDDIIAVNTRLRDALNKRQKAYAVVERIGDILLDAVPHFNPFVSYGAHQLYGKYEFEKEKSSNPAFAQFVEVTERLPESRKLELNAYLTKPTTRLARYPLLLGAVLKHTPEDHPDKTSLVQVIDIIRGFLAKVNTESGRTENRFNLLQLEQQLTFRPGEEVDLRLSEEGREMIYKGTLSKRDGELHLWLFDHALLVAKSVKIKQVEQYKVYRRPIPLELLQIVASDEAFATARAQGSRHNPPITPARSDAKQQHWITFVHLGRKYYTLTLWAPTLLSQRKWVESIVKQQSAMRERSLIFDTITLSQSFFTGINKVNCAAPFSAGRRVVYGTDDGVFLSDLRDASRDPIKVLALAEVRQVDILEDYQLLVVLSEGQVITFPLDALDPMDPMAGLKRAKKVSSHTSFFKAGFCLGKVLVCIVKSSQLSSTFKMMEPVDSNVRNRSKPTFKALLQGGHETLKSFREFYIPVESTSIHYLKTKMCVGCSRGFEIVDLESLDTQGLLDPNDDSLDFVRKRENLRPMAIYRIGNEFLLCYDVFAFYVNRNGQRSRKDFLIHWEGNPVGFALHEPYVLAFEPSFVEVRHIESGFLSQVIQGTNMSLLFADTPPSVTHSGAHGYAPSGYDFNPYGGAPSHQGSSRMSLNSGHPGSSLGWAPQGVGRHEILIASDDRVLALRPATAVDSNSIVSAR